MATRPRNLPDQDDPVAQPMPPPVPPPADVDPAHVPDPAAPLPNGDHTSGPLSPTPEASPPAPDTHYEARIQILDAYQYPGALKGAPDWVDRNWIGYAADEDPLRGIEPGPCLRVPVHSGVTGICRVGDYVCRQSVILTPGEPPDIRLEVWPREQFVKMFVPRGPAIDAT